jgi:hypothetical protein
MVSIKTVNNEDRVNEKTREHPPSIGNMLVSRS